MPYVGFWKAGVGFRQFVFGGRQFLYCRFPVFPEFRGIGHGMGLVGTTLPTKVIRIFQVVYAKNFGRNKKIIVRYIPLHATHANSAMVTRMGIIATKVSRQFGS
jgi:hypothetical protein